MGRIFDCLSGIMLLISGKVLSLRSCWGSGGSIYVLRFPECCDESCIQSLAWCIGQKYVLQWWPQTLVSSPAPTRCVYILMLFNLLKPVYWALYCPVFYRKQSCNFFQKFIVSILLLHLNEFLRNVNIVFLHVTNHTLPRNAGALMPKEQVCLFIFTYVYGKILTKCYYG